MLSCFMGGHNLTQDITTEKATLCVLKLSLEASLPVPVYQVSFCDNLGDTVDLAVVKTDKI